MATQPKRQHVLTLFPTRFRADVQANARRYCSGIEDDGGSIHDALDCAFSWGNSRQGSAYYRRLGERYTDIQHGRTLTNRTPLCQTHPT